MLDRTRAPEFVPPQKFKLPQPGKIALSNGSTLYYLNAGDQPVIKLEFIFKAGVWFENNTGISFFAAKMLLEGTVSFKSSEIAGKLDRYGAFVEVNPGFDYITLSVNIPAKNFTQVDSLITEILFNPTFPESEFDLMRKIHVQQLKVNEQKNQFVASRLFRKQLFEGSPYGNVMNEENLNLLTPTNLTTHFESWMKGKFDIFITGQFDVDLPEKLGESFNHQLKETHDFHEISIKDQPTFFRKVEKTESLQSSIFMGKRSINKTHANYPGLLLLNEIFGGYFGSRLTQNIREDKGFTYSIYSHLATLKNAAYFVISSEVKKEYKEQVLDEIRKEIKQIKDHKVGEEELVQAKNHLKGSVNNSLTSPFALMEKLKNILLYDLGYDFYDQLFDQIDAIDATQLNLLANELLFNEDLSAVIVG